MHPIAGVLVRGTTVVARDGGGTVGSADSCARTSSRSSSGCDGRRRAPAPDVAPPETTEFAGEIVATDLPDQRTAAGRPSRGAGGGTMSAARRRGTWLALSAIVALALVLRLIGLQVRIACRLQPGRSRDHDAGAELRARHAEPAQLPLSRPSSSTSCSPGLASISAFVWVTGRVASIAALQRLLFTDPTGIYTAGRTLGVVAGTVTVAAIFSLGARLTDTRTALAAARVPRRRAAARPRLPLRQARRAGDARDRPGVSGDEPALAGAAGVSGRDGARRCSRAPPAASRSRRTTTASFSRYR